MKESEIRSSTDAKLLAAPPTSVSPMASPDEPPSRTDAMSITMDTSETVHSITNSIDTHTPIDVSDSLRLSLHARVQDVLAI